MKRSKVIYQVSITLKNGKVKYQRFNSARRLRAVISHLELYSLGVWKLTPVIKFRKSRCYKEERIVRLNPHLREYTLGKNWIKK
jgi:hypothetical protein